MSADGIRHIARIVGAWLREQWAALRASLAEAHRDAHWYDDYTAPDATQRERDRAADRTEGDA